MGESWKWRVATKIRCVMRCLRDRFSREICIEGVCVKDWYESLKTCYNRIWQNGGETRYVVLTIFQCLSYTQALYWVCEILFCFYCHFEWMRWLFIGIVWDLVVIVQSVLSFCSWFCCDGGFIFPLSDGCSFIELVLRSVIFVICGLLRMRIVFSSCSFWPCRLFGIIVHCC